MSNSLRGDDWHGAPGAVDRFNGSTRETCLSQLTTVFLDRDGVINENRGEHVKSWSEFQFIPGAREAIARLSRHGVRVFVVSNQAIINRVIVSSADVEAINAAMVREIEKFGGRIDGIAYCPHRSDEGCACRKPQPGLLLKLATDYGIDLRQSLLIGDSVSDLEAGRAAGCATVLVLTGRGRDQMNGAFASGRPCSPIGSDLMAIADLVLGASTD